MEREDLSTGGTDAAISEFSRTPGRRTWRCGGFVYSCGYATAFNDRPFMLPVSARVTRPADVLTQGILAKTLLDVVARGGAGATIVAMDVVPMPDAPAALGLDSLAQIALPDGMGFIATGEAKPPDAPTPLALALIAALKGPEVQTTTLLGVVQQQLNGKPVALAALRPPVSNGYLGRCAAPSAPAGGAPTGPDHPGCPGPGHRRLWCRRHRRCPPPRNLCCRPKS